MNFVMTKGLYEQGLESRWAIDKISEREGVMNEELKLHWRQCDAMNKKTPTWSHVLSREMPESLALPWPWFFLAHSARYKNEYYK
jgi:hypothetical protein